MLKDAIQRTSCHDASQNNEILLSGSYKRMSVMARVLKSWDLLFRSNVCKFAMDLATVFLRYL